jgi:hypothetical protein
MRKDAMSPSEQAVIEKERAVIGISRAERLGEADAPWSGIGLSGGGIRSATFCLGVLQALAQMDLLRRFDYISSVSGGGYTATSLQWWWGSPREDGDGAVQTAANRYPFGLGASDFPYGPVRPDPDFIGPPAPTLARGMGNLAFLRAHSSYLTPGHGLTLWSILGVLFRTVLISSLTWLPLLAVGFVGLSAVGYLLDWAFGWLHVRSPFFGLLPIPSRWTELCHEDLLCHLGYPALYALGLWGVYIITGLVLAAALLFVLVSRAPQDNRHHVRTISIFGAGALLSGGASWWIFAQYQELDISTLLIAAALAVMCAVWLVIVASELLTPRSLNASYWLRRKTEQFLGVAFLPSLAVLVFSTIPLIPFFSIGYIASYGPKAAIGALVGLLSGVGSALYGYYTFLRNVVPGVIGQIVATAGAMISLYMTAVIAYVLATLFLHSNDTLSVPTTLLSLLATDNGMLSSADTELFKAVRPYIQVGVGGAMLLAMAIAFFANINLVGFHRFYRDRLMEAFMPKDSAVEKMQSDFSPVADSLSVGALRRYFEARKPGDRWRARPYPLINTNVILIADDNQKVASRGGDNFVISPFVVGSSSTGWQDTLEYIECNGPLTLASAMAASGAAANASAGSLGTGITTNPFVSAVMTLLNMRLGLWVSNPSRPGWRRARSIPTFLMTGIYSAFYKHRHDSKFLELTDGGHFENLGLYELVRRKLQIVLIIDGEEDPSISLSSLVSATRRVEQDFGARIDFPSGEAGPERLVMYPSASGYPAGVKYAKAPFLVGTIAYNDGSHGVLIYVKATIIREMDFTTAGYLANNPAFPHQTTVDQFFDPDQFDAYRFLGYESGLQMIRELDLQKSIRDCGAVASKYDERSESQVT